MFGRKKKKDQDKDKGKRSSGGKGSSSSSSKGTKGTTSTTSSKQGVSSSLAKMSLDGKRKGSSKDKRSSTSSAAQGSSTTATSSSSSSSSSSSKKNSISYAAERVIGNGSFGVVYQATVIESGETVAIKKVLQDRRFKNRELQIMRTLNHPCVVSLKHSFLARGERPDDVFLNLVMEFIPETIHRTLRNHTKAKKLVPVMYTKVYMFQICRALAYIHSMGICHRDIKPQNLLLDPSTHIVKLCDFGSAKMLVRGQPNVAYICSRYYRAPELVFEATEYTTAIDVWSLGCVMAELLLGKPLFPGESGVDQLIEIIKILGTPTRDEIHAMNPNHTTFSFPQIAAHPWSKVFKGKAVPDNAIDLLQRLLQYKPKDRLDPFEALLHPFFDDLRKPDARLPNSKPITPVIFNFTRREVKRAVAMGVDDKLFPPHIRELIDPAFFEDGDDDGASGGGGGDTA